MWAIGTNESGLMNRVRSSKHKADSKNTGQPTAELASQRKAGKGMEGHRDMLRCSPARDGRKREKVEVLLTTPAKMLCHCIHSPHMTVRQGSRMYSSYLYGGVYVLKITMDTCIIARLVNTID